MATIEEVERDLMRALLAGENPLMDVLRTQYSVARVKGRDVTSSGFTTWFDVPSDLPLVDRDLLHLDDLQVSLAGVDAPAEAAVTVEKGRLRSLECSVYAGDWPASPEITAAWYYGTARFPGVTPELLAARDVEPLLEEGE